MIFRGRKHLCLLAAISLFLNGGCSLSDSGTADEETEPHYQLGVSRMNALDFSGAEDAFNESLRVNPRSAAAHFKLACLFDTDTNKQLYDPAAAIYHYQEFLKLKPQAEKAEFARDRIRACKFSLREDVTAMPAMPASQKQLEQLVATNRALHAEVEQWRSYYAKEQSAAKAENTAGQSLVTQPLEKKATVAEVPQKVAPIKFRTYVVAKHETFATIARKYHLSAGALQEANPGVNPARLRVGQTINLPP